MQRALSFSACLLLSCGLSAAAHGAIRNPIVFVAQEPVPFTFATISDIFGNFTSYDPREGQPGGGNLLRLDPDGTVANLTGRAGAAVRDPEISYDGSTVAFSMKTRPRGRWKVYTIGVDGSDLRKISRGGKHNDWDPAFLPDGRILFLSDRLRWSDGYENLPEGQLFVMGPDGRGVESLAVNPSGIFNPLLGSDGLVYFTQWDFHDCRASIDEDECDLDVNRFLLWQIAIDGSREGHPSFGNHTLYDFAGGYVGIRENPRQLGTFFATLADEFFTFGAGAIVRMKPIFVTENVFEVGKRNRAGRYRDPYPLADGRLAASFAAGAVYDEDGSQAPDFNLVLVDAGSGARTQLLNDPEMWLLQPVEAVGRPMPDLAPGAAAAGFDYGVVNAKDVTIRHRNCNRVVNGDCQQAIRPREAAEVRFYEVARRKNYYREVRMYADPRQKLLGTVPVRADGSFAAAVPAGTPLIWEILDGSGQVLVKERFWTEVAAGEARTCNGCHSPHNGRRVKRPNSALRHVTNLTGKAVDRDGNGLVDLLEALGLVD